MFELLLLLGLLALFAAHWRTLARLRQVEERLNALLSAPPAQAIEAEPERWKAAPVEARQTSAMIDAPSVSDADTRGSPAPEPTPVKETLAGLFERFVGGRLLIWIGGIALAVAGVFLIRYSIEIGLVTPPVRMLMAAAFGALLVGAGEVARSRAGLTPDPRIAQALVGAGILVLYAAPYGAHVLYGLIGLFAASALMGLVTVAALLLSLRHGAPTAVLGLAGGFLTPLLVGNEDVGAVPLLFYLALLDLALFAIAQRRGWTWLAAGAVLLSFLWTGALALSGAQDALAAGVFILFLSLGASLANPGQGRQLRLIQPAAIGLVQLALLVARTDTGAAAWALFGALALASLFLAWRRPEHRLLPAIALALTLLLLAVKSLIGADPVTPFAGIATTIVFAAYGWWKAAGADRLASTLTASAAFAGPALILRAGDFGLIARPGWGALLLLLAIGPAALAWRQRAHSREGALPDLPLLAASGTAALLLATAAYDLLPARLLPAAWLAIALGIAACGRKVRDSAISMAAIALCALAIVWILPMVAGLWETLAGSVAGEPALAAGLPGSGDALLLLALPAGLILLLCPMLPYCYGRARAFSLSIAGLFLTGAAYILFKQAFGLSSVAEFAARGFGERTIITQALFVAGWLLASERVRLPLPGSAQRIAGTALTMLAAARFVWFDCIIHNPVFATQNVGSLPLLNLILPAFFGTALFAYLARRRGAGSGGWLVLMLVALVAGTALMVRQMFQGAILTGPDLPLAEFYGYSLAGLLLSIALLTAGVKLPDKALRFAGLLLLTATIIKVFLIDAAALDGLLRILSFLGLGVALIGIGKLYSKVLAPAPATQSGKAGGSVAEKAR